MSDSQAQIHSKARVTRSRTVNTLSRFSAETKPTSGVTETVMMTFPGVTTCERNELLLISDCNIITSNNEYKSPSLAISCSSCKAEQSDQRDQRDQRQDRVVLYRSTEPFHPALHLHSP